MTTGQWVSVQQGHFLPFPPTDLMGVLDKEYFQIGLMTVFHKIQLLIGLMIILGKKPQTLVSFRLMGALHPINQELRLVGIGNHKDFNVGLMGVLALIKLLSF